MNDDRTSPANAPVRTLPPVGSAAALAILVGIVEVIYGQYRAAVGTLQLNVMFLVIGLLLYYGSARVIAVVRWLIMFGLVPALLIPFQVMAITPLDLTLVQLRLHTAEMAHVYLPLIVTAAATAFAAWRLACPQVAAALRAHGVGKGGVKVPIILGALLFVAATGLIVNGLQGKDAQRAEQLAAQRFGPDYRYFTNRVHIVAGEDTTVHAVVQVWNDKEAWQVPVQWRR